MDIFTHSKIKRASCRRGSADLEIEDKGTTDA